MLYLFSVFTKASAPAMLFIFIVTYKLISLPRERVSCEYSGFTITQSQRCSSLISPCGSLVFAAGAPGELHVWNSDTGQHTCLVMHTV